VHHVLINREKPVAGHADDLFLSASILLSGFMFPFRGMPEWAQWLANVLPLTHFLVLVRGIMLKGNELAELWPQIWPIVAFMLAVIVLGLRFYKRTLDLLLSFFNSTQRPSRIF